MGIHVKHTLAERRRLRKIKQASGPCKTRRRERRKPKQEAYAQRIAEQKEP